MTLEDVIENINSYVSGSWVLEHKRDDLLKMLTELKERRESELRTANKFLGIGPYEQYKHYVSEKREVSTAFIVWFYLETKTKDIGPYMIDHINKYKKDLAMEIIDTQMSGETLLAELGYNEEQRRGLRKEVIEKNNARGYYNTTR